MSRLSLKVFQAVWQTTQWPRSKILTASREINLFQNGKNPCRRALNALHEIYRATSDVLFQVRNVISDMHFEASSSPSTMQSSTRNLLSAMEIVQALASMTSCFVSVPHRHIPTHAFIRFPIRYLSSTRRKIRDSILKATYLRSTLTAASL